MRLHHLQVTAFGPFAETVQVDFDELSSAGLFLLSGATGAGKTSVLDAVCFALYGDVPGDRAAARRLRCDQAVQGVAPEVRLEATLSGRRFRLVRSPAWDRAKKRGTGVTREHAKVTVSESVGGTWVHLSSRLDETGDLVTRLVGMNLTQFTQVALLPQGRFQEFLRARSEDRHALLQQLFRTRRFAEVERWLRDRRICLRREAELADQAVADLVSRVSEAAGAAVPAEPGLAWAEGLRAEAHVSLAAARARKVAAESEQATSRSEVEAARASHERRRARRTAEEEWEALRSRQPDHELEVHTLARARRAASVTPLALLAEGARRKRDGAGRAVAALPDADRDLVEQEVEEARRGASAAQALRPRETRQKVVAGEVAGLRLRSEVLDVQLRLTRLEALVTTETALTGAREAWLSAREHALASGERLHQVREARLQSMAGEIAGALAVGACCPVCGSAEHPHKAGPVAGAPDAATEKAAHKVVDDAKSTEHLRQTEVRDLETRASALREQAGSTDLDDLRARHGEAQAELARLRADGADISQLPTDPESVQREAGAVAARLDALTDELVALTREIDDVLATSDCDDLASLFAAHTRRAEAGLLALRSLEALATAETIVADAERALMAAATEAGFASITEALAAALPDSAVAELATATAQHERRLAAVTEVLAETAGAEVGDLPDLAAAEARHASAVAELSAAGGEVSLWTTRTRRLDGLVVELEATLASWAPLRDDLELTVRLSAFVEGKAPDNRLQMRLSAYVLAYRFGQVVAAANTRLAGMSDQRYSLEHTGERAAGETRGGLSLRVRDDWSGEARDPATLSGGETFVVSLALALGLSDVITQESGGADLDTLFVDEGFGALDADTLDDVMDTLDSLRDGGRVVGVVSHVAEMRDRIPTQLVVAKSRGGSTVSVRR